MKSYDQSIELFGHEIADDIIRRQEDPNWEITFDRIKVAGSLSAIYDKDIRKATEDLENSIKKASKKIRENLEQRIKDQKKLEETAMIKATLR